MSSDNSTVVTLSLGLGSSTLQGTLSRTAVNGVVSFTNLSYNVAETINLTFVGGSLTGTASSNVVVSAGAANRLTIQTQPGATAALTVARKPWPCRQRARCPSGSWPIRRADSNVAAAVKRRRSGISPDYPSRANARPQRRRARASTSRAASLRSRAWAR